MTYAYDEKLGKWVVMIDDVVVKHCDTEQEAKDMVEPPDAVVSAQDASVYAAYCSYLKKATGIDLLDPLVKGVDLSLITVDTEWNDTCLNEARSALETKEERAAFFLFVVVGGRLPTTVKGLHFLGIKSKCIKEPGGIIYGTD